MKDREFWEKLSAKPKKRKARQGVKGKNILKETKTKKKEERKLR